MRLWSLHPRYLDSKGLVALWREGLLAKKVLENKTKGYRNHPQLIRFKESPCTLTHINMYLHSVCDEADLRGYHFDRKKLSRCRQSKVKLEVTDGQLDFEWKHLIKKLKGRSPELYKKLKNMAVHDPHPLFTLVKGGVEDWEIQ